MGDLSRARRPNTFDLRVVLELPADLDHDLSSGLAHRRDGKPGEPEDHHSSQEPADEHLGDRDVDNPERNPRVRGELVHERSKEEEASEGRRSDRVSLDFVGGDALFIMFEMLLAVANGL